MSKVSVRAQIRASSPSGQSTSRRQPPMTWGVEAIPGQLAERFRFSNPQNRAESAPVPAFPACPHLPPPRPGLDWTLLAAHRDAHRGADFYLDCLEYAHALWGRGLAARS